MTAYETQKAPPALLAALLEPLAMDEFLGRYWLRQHVLCRGAADRFAGLLSWPVLNRILEHHWRETYRFRLARQGRDLDPESYTERGGLTHRICAKAITEQLRGGATLSFDAIDEVHEPLTRLAEAFERFFRAGTQINIYAGWRRCHGLDLHRDDEEIFIAQLDGRKRWLLYGSNAADVDRSRLGEHSTPPGGAQFEEILVPGDLLYIPRGCYHLAVPMNEPTLHLTIGVKNPRELDLLQWLVERYRADGAAERDLPCLSGSDERLRGSERLRNLLLDGLDADLVAQYLADTCSNGKPRPMFNLPWSATAQGLPPGRGFLLQLRAPAALDATSASNGVVVRHAGRSYRFPRGVTSIVEQLADGAPHPIGEVMDGLGDRFDQETVRLLVGLLVKHDLIAVTASGDERP